MRLLKAFMFALVILAATATTQAQVKFTDGTWKAKAILVSGADDVKQVDILNVDPEEAGIETYQQVKVYGNQSSIDFITADGKTLTGKISGVGDSEIKLGTNPFGVETKLLYSDEDGKINFTQMIHKTAEGKHYFVMVTYVKDNN